MAGNVIPLFSRCGPRLICAVVLGIVAQTGVAVQINRGGMPRQVPRPPEFGGADGGETVASAQPLQAPQYLVPHGNIRLKTNMMEFHQLHGQELGSDRAIDADNATQMWIVAPRKLSYLEIEMAGLSGPVARVVLVEHATDFCKNCRFRPIRDARGGQASHGGGAQIAFDRQSGEDINILPPMMIHGFRIEVAQTQIVWWQLYEIMVWSTHPVAQLSDTQRRNLQQGVREEPTPQPNVQRLIPLGHQHNTQSPQPAPGHGQAPAPAVCNPPCVNGHGMCAPRPPHAKIGAAPHSGICICQAGWIGIACADAYCSDCPPGRGQCVAPHQCSCHTGWSGRSCNVKGEVQYGMRLKLGCNRQPKHVLSSPPDSSVPGQPALAVQPVLATEIVISDAGGNAAGEGENWWTVLGPPGTSNAFLRNYNIVDGATVRLRHCGSAIDGGACIGGWLTVRPQIAAVARRDCKMVGVAPAKGEGAPTAGEDAWHVYVDRGSQLSVPTGRAWGMGSEVVLVHVRSGSVLASNGNFLAVKSVGRTYQLPEVHGQPLMAHSPAQQWTVQNHAPPLRLDHEVSTASGDAHMSTAIPYYSIVRLTAAPRSDDKATAASKSSDLTSACYLATTVSGSVDCVRALTGHELWLLLPPSTSKVDDTLLPPNKTAAPVAMSLGHAKRFRLAHVLSLGTIQVVRKDSGKKGVAVAEALPPHVSGLYNKQADCLTISMQGGFAVSEVLPEAPSADSNDGNVGTTNQQPWGIGEEAALYFCSSKLSLSLESTGTRWIPELVKILPSDSSEDDLAAAAGELAMERHLFKVAASHYTVALQKRSVLAMMRAAAAREAQEAAREKEAAALRAAQALVLPDGWAEGMLEDGTAYFYPVNEPSSITFDRPLPPLPSGWATGELEDGTVYYHPLLEPTNVVFERPLPQLPSMQVPRPGEAASSRRKGRKGKRRRLGKQQARVVGSNVSNRGRIHLVPTHMLYFKRAIVRVHLAQSDAAIWDLDKALEEAPTFLEALLYRSRICLTMGRWESARSGFDKIVAESSSRIGSKAGSTLYRAEQYVATLQNVSVTLARVEEALAVARQAYVGGARCTMGLEDRQVLEWTRVQLTSILSVAPESVSVRLLRAEASLLLSDYGNVKGDATWAVRMSGGDPRGYFLRAQAHHYAMDDQLGLEFYRWCVKIDHDHAGCRAGIKSIRRADTTTMSANTYFRLGDFEAALAEFAAGIEAAPSHCSLVALLRLQRCRCFIYLNQTSSAVLECKRSFEHDPNLTEAEYLMKNAKTIARTYQAEQEQKKLEEEKRQKEEERAAQKEKRDKKQLLRNATNISRIYVIGDEDRMEARINSMGECEQCFFRLNMTNITHPLPPVETTTNDVKRAYRKVSMVWHPDKHRGEKAKARAEKKFQQIVSAYDILGDEAQLHRCLQGQEPKSEQQQQQEQQPREPPKPGRPPDEPPPEEPPIQAHLAWSSHGQVAGLLPPLPHRVLLQKGSAEAMAAGAANEMQGGGGGAGGGAEIRYSLTVEMTEIQEGNIAGEVSKVVGVQAWGSPDSVIVWRNGEEPEADDPRRKYHMKDEFGSATAGSFDSSFGSSGDGSGNGGADSPLRQQYPVPSKGQLSIRLDAPLGSRVGGEEQRHISVEIQEYHASEEILRLQAGEKAMISIKFALDSREGPLYCFLGVSRGREGEPKLLLDSVTVSFSSGYWQKRTSLARKRRLATMANLKAAPGYSLHHATDGETHTVFKSAAPLVQNQALVVDLAMIFVIAKVQVLEEDYHGCVHCILEFSCDQREWFQVHTFEEGSDELVEWNVGVAADGETLDEMGFLVPTQRPMPRLARYIRIRATRAAEPVLILDADGHPTEESEPPPHWHVKELYVFGEELSQSISTDAPVWLDIVKSTDDSADIEPMVAQADHSVSHATDADLNTVFISLAAPKAGHVLMIDLQDVHRLAMIELYQPREHGCCVHCVIEGALEQQDLSWQILATVQGAASHSTFKAFSPNDDDHNGQQLVRFLRIRHMAPMTALWQVIDFVVHGVVLIASEAGPSTL